jgi:hypothetical protein
LQAQDNYSTTAINMSRAARVQGKKEVELLDPYLLERRTSESKKYMYKN